MSGYFDYWGKARSGTEARPFHRLPFHGLDVAAVAAVLLDEDDRVLARAAQISGFPADELRGQLPYLLALHDLGKFSEPFQLQQPELASRLQPDRPTLSCPLYHDTLGYQLWRAWAARTPLPEEADLLTTLHELRAPGGVERRDVDALMQSWMAAVLGHHGRPPGEDRLPWPVLAAGARSRRDAAAFARDVHALLSPRPLVSVTDDLDALEARMRRSSWWLAGLAILCDWLGSDEAFFLYEDREVPLEVYWRERALPAARNAVRQSGLVGARPRRHVEIGELFPEIAARLSPLQRAARDVELGEGPRLFVLEDLTGAGKTEAALVLAHRLMSAGRGDGLFFALPTMATANAMDARVRPLVDALLEGEPSYLLTHSGPRLTERDRLALCGASSSEPYGPNEASPGTRAAAAWLADGRKKALLADVGVGTIDQALLAALQSRHAALRLFGLHRRVLVVDEVHACDTYMLGVLCELLRAHAALGGSAVLLSATLPTEQRVALARAFEGGLAAAGPRPSSSSYPLLSGFGASTIELPVAPREGARRTVPIEWHGSVESVIARLVAAAETGACACWIRNSVKDAVDAYDALAARLGAERVTLFHARFALGDRLRIEQGVVDRFGIAGAAEARRGRVVVATQVVEQSLDIDFDVMVSDLCPVDLVIQRAGRLQRHARHAGRAPPVMELFAPAACESPSEGWLAGPFRRTAHVYPDAGVLWRTVAALTRRGRLALPEDARALVEEVYASDEVPLALERAAAAATGAELAHGSVARTAVISLDGGYLRVGADWSSDARTPTRLGEPTTTVRLARVEGDTAAPWIGDAAEARLRWPLSQVSVARRLVAGPDAGDQALRAALAADQPFTGEDVVTVLLRDAGDGTWTGAAVAEEQRGGALREIPVRLVYSNTRGLDVSRGS